MLFGCHTEGALAGRKCPTSDGQDFPARAVETRRSQLAEARRHDQRPKAKALLRLLVAEIAVSGRSEIQPTYRLPPEADQPVRPTAEKVELAGLEPSG